MGSQQEHQRSFHLEISEAGTLICIIPRLACDVYFYYFYHVWMNLAVPNFWFISPPLVTGMTFICHLHFQ